MPDFVGTKIALVCGDKLLMILRDDTPGLRFAGMWDFPGGGREKGETPLQCVIREVEEELSIRLKPDSILLQKEVESMHDPNLRAYFFVAKVTQNEIDAIQFGKEGQRWGLMSIDDFFGRSDVVPKLKDRFKDYFDSIKPQPE